MLAILDYKAGNQTSVRRALEHLGIPCAITADPAALDAAQGIIFPGVGAAGQAMGALRASGVAQVLRRDDRAPAVDVLGGIAQPSNNDGVVIFAHKDSYHTTLSMQPRRPRVAELRQHLPQPLEGHAVDLVIELIDSEHDAADVIQAGRTRDHRTPPAISRSRARGQLVR